MRNDWDEEQSKIWLRFSCILYQLNKEFTNEIYHRKPENISYTKIGIFLVNNK